MSGQLNTEPTYEEPLTKKGFTTRGWYTFWTGLRIGQPTGFPSAVALPVSPASLKAPGGGTFIIQGGSVSLVSFTRDGVTNFNTGQTQGMFPVSLGDVLIINYTGTPAITFVPR